MIFNFYKYDSRVKFPRYDGEAKFNKEAKFLVLTH